MSYHGVRQVDRTVKIATAVGSESVSTTTEIYDRQGRLLSVTEPSGSGGANVTTTYGYDVGNRLASVSTPANVNGTQVTQTRAFSYDLAGLLKSEIHPEKGASGNGSVTYTSYDSRGHALRKTDGPHDLVFAYDSAERLSQVREYGTNGINGKMLKSFTYSSANGNNEWSKGKLQLATRYNYETVLGGPIIVQVDETYTYAGRDGRVSQRDTKATPTVNGTVQPLHSFTQGFTYNELGLVSSLSYPLCTDAGCTQSAPPVFADVPAGTPNQKEIEGIYFAGITSGCQSSPQLLYCPSDAVTRAQMAVFLLVAKGTVPPACTTPVFADVPCSSPYAPYVNELAREGVTIGCATNPLQYCPNNPVTNAQMAVFLIQILGISPATTCSVQPYPDVPCGYWAANWIAEETRRQFTSGCGGGNFCPDSAITRSSMAALIARAFNISVPTDPNTQRSASFTYMQGLLTGVTSGTTTYGTLSYYPNLLVSQISHGNGVTEMQTNDPNEMRRPASLSASGNYASWSSGTYGYDGAGNVKTIGSATFTYDSVSRLVASSLYDGPTGAGNLKQQSYIFDAFGNMTSIGGTSGRSTPTSPQTNRLNGTGTVYDAAGNLTNWNSAVYNYDDFNQMTHMTSGSQEWVYLYTADDERIWMYNIPANSSRWTLRDLNGKVLREYLSTGRWSVGTDYFYRDGLLLAAETQTGQRHFHLDHLGTPRLITRGSGYAAAYHVYYPFGEEATAFNQDTERIKFTGHERDLASPSGASDDLDYMHARHESPVTGRFLSADPALKSANPKSPQTWDRYAYVAGNPLKYLDPSGEILNFFGTADDLSKLQEVANQTLQGVDLVIDQNGRASLVPNNEVGPASPEQQAFADTLSSAINSRQSVNIGVTSGDIGITFGQYATGRIDIQDIAAVGSGRGVNSASALAHEIAEQTAKQTMGLSNTPNDFAQAHRLAVSAQQKVSGYILVYQEPHLNRQGTGYIISDHGKGSDTVTVTFRFVNGNLVRVDRREH